MLISYALFIFALTSSVVAPPPPRPRPQGDDGSGCLYDSDTGWKPLNTPPQNKPLDQLVPLIPKDDQVIPFIKDAVVV